MGKCERNGGQSENCASRDMQDEIVEGSELPLMQAADSDNVL